MNVWKYIYSKTIQTLEKDLHLVFFGGLYPLLLKKYLVSRLMNIVWITYTANLQYL